jgi:hypothetical protein
VLDLAGMVLNQETIWLKDVPFQAVFYWLLPMFLALVWCWGHRYVPLVNKLPLMKDILCARGITNVIPYNNRAK